MPCLDYTIRRNKWVNHVERASTLPKATGLRMASLSAGISHAILLKR